MSSYITSKYLFYVSIDWCISVAKGAISASTERLWKGVLIYKFIFEITGRCILNRHFVSEIIR